MLNYMFMPFRRYAEFRGRSRRMEFWAFGLFNVLAYVIIGAIAFGIFGTYRSAVQGGNVDYSAMFSMVTGGAGLLLGVYWLATVIPALAVTVRRLHDRDMSGWWYLGFIVLSAIPLVGMIAGIALFVIMVLPGTPGPNRYGSDPKDPSSAEVFA